MTAARDTLADRIGRHMARKLDAPVPGFRPFTHANVAALRQVLQPGDVLLVEGNSRVSVAIKYLTQSTWSHAALYVGNAVGRATPDGELLCLIEVNLGDGCIAAPLSKYQHYNTRICRPNNLTPQDRARLIDFMVQSLGKSYDMKNITDLLRYSLPTPPVPVRWRRRLLSFGSGDPTRAICSSLIAQAFGRIRYPILPVITREFRANRTGPLAAQRDPAHPPPLALRAARLRPLAVFPRGQADAGGRIRLSEAEMVRPGRRARGAGGTLALGAPAPGENC